MAGVGICLDFGGASVGIRYGEPGSLISSITSTFSRRYLPPVRPADCPEVLQATG